MNKLILFALTISACTPATLRRDLRYVANGTEIAAQASLACDWSSTNRSVGNGYVESNPVMGEHPDHSVTGVYFLGAGLAVAAYNRVLPDAARILANVVIVGAEFDAVLSNHDVGADPHGCGL